MSISDIQQTNPRSTRGRVPMGRFVLSGEELDVTPIGATVQLVDGQHDQVTVSVTSATLTDTKDIVDSPISFFWGVSPHGENFTGYVTEVTEESQGASGALTFSMTILGPTREMYSGYPRFWVRQNVTSAVRDLVAKSSLGFYGHDHTFLWKALAQTEETDWEMVTKLARRVGWRVWSRYGCVLLYDPLKLFRESGSYCRLFTGTAEDISTDRTLLEFLPQELDATSIKVRGTKYGYFTSSGTPQIAKTGGDVDLYNFNTGVVISDQDAATAYVDADSSDLDTWKQSAMARIWGDADIYPGMCVDVVTTNRRYLRNKFDGKWLVRGAGHKMDRQQYQTLLYLVRPLSTAAAGVTAYIPFWRLTDISAAKPTLTSNEGKWISSKAERRSPQGTP